MTHYALPGQIHIVAGCLALLIGAGVVWSTKGSPLHRFAGILYVFAMLALNISALTLYDMTGRFGPFHVGALFSSLCLLQGLAAVIRKQGGWLRAHYRWMGWSYFGLVAAAFAEAAVRVPAFRVNTVQRGFAVAIGATVVISLFGRLFMGLLERELHRVPVAAPNLHERAS